MQNGGRGTCAGPNCPPVISHATQIRLCAQSIVQGRTLKLRHGWVAVVNRGQADLNSKVRWEGVACALDSSHCYSLQPQRMK
jgi:hypothetical protein